MQAKQNTDFQGPIKRDKYCGFHGKYPNSFNIYVYYAQVVEHTDLSFTFNVKISSVLELFLANYWLLLLLCYLMLHCLA